MRFEKPAKEKRQGRVCAHTHKCVLKTFKSRYVKVISEKMNTLHRDISV